MSIINFIDSVCVQTAVHWSSPTPDGYGGMEWGERDEIGVRWEEKTEVVSDGKGREIVSKAVVMLTADVKEGDMLFLGTLEDVGDTPPESIETAYMVKRSDRSPLFRSTTEFVKQVYL